jgi:conjugal transfer pilus assembly protein TraE
VDQKTYISRLAQAADIKRLVFAVLAASLVMNCLLVLGLYTVATNQSLTVRVNVPATLQKSFWVQRDKASREWVEQMGLFVAQLSLNVTPSSVEYQGKLMLDLVSPSARGAIKKQVDMNALRIQRSNVATFFTPRDSVFDPKNPNRVALKGDLTTVLTDKTVNKRPVTYVVAFAFEDGTQRLVEAFETNPTDPLGLEPAKDQK